MNSLDRRHATLALLVAGGLHCGTGAPSVREQFATSVVPVLERRCAATACHGVPAGGVSARDFTVPVDDVGKIAGRERVDRAYENARRFVDTTEVPELSTLLRKGVPIEFGGVAHGGGETYRDPQDAAFMAVRAWIVREHGGGEDQNVAMLTEGQRYFGEHVQPLLASSQCMLSPCHGPAAGFPMRFDPGVPGAFGVRATVANYREALVHLALGGWPEQSRIIRKTLDDPTIALPHRGGNGITAFPGGMDDPLPRAVVEWARVERRVRSGGAPEHSMAGIVFVGGPVRGGRVTEHDAFVPGTDLYMLAPPDATGSVRNLSASLHTQAAEIRSPAVDDSGSRIAFSMRRDSGEGATIWEIDLASGTGRALTQPARRLDGSAAMDLSPTYGPDGRVWFVSDRAGVLGEHGRTFDTDLYVIERDGTIAQRSHTPSPELTPTFFRTGRETAGAVAFTAIRQLGEDLRGVVYRFPDDLHSEYHQHFGITIADDVTYRMRERPDGTFVAVALDRDAAWDAGALVLVDRNLGPEIYNRETARASIPAFVHPVSFLGPYGSHDDLGTNVRRTSSAEGAYRDPAPLPDGRVVVSWAPGPVALTDASQPPTFSLYVLTLGRRALSEQASVLSREPLVDLAGMDETEPVGVYVNPPTVVPAAHPQGATGIFDHGGALILEDLLRQVPAVGERVVRGDIAAARLLEWVPRSNDAARGPMIAELYPEQRRTGATPHLPARVLAEVPVESDGTFVAELDAGTSFRLEWIDAGGMSVGIQHNRWFDIQGGQHLRQGIQLEAYDRACTHCHGSRSGQPTEAFAPVDLTARASLSLARMTNNDATLPRAPVRVGDGTRWPSEWSSAVRPLLVRSCASASCHDATTRAGSLALVLGTNATYDGMYEALVARGASSAHGFQYVDVVGTRARASYLIERLIGGELDAPGTVPGPAPHRGSPPLSDAEIRTIVRWIESGALYCVEDCP